MFLGASAIIIITLNHRVLRKVTYLYLDTCRLNLLLHLRNRNGVGKPKLVKHAVALQWFQNVQSFFTPFLLFCEAGIQIDNKKCQDLFWKIPSTQRESNPRHGLADTSLLFCFWSCFCFQPSWILTVSIFEELLVSHRVFCHLQHFSFLIVARPSSNVFETCHHRKWNKGCF